ncbi:succinate-semialdehyde dehydrogenase / glutarate-semialdehyde dehydrogenase [Arthrobacter sp. 31Cvi3.1E]|nr:succinate-semialdehyde dehydrogenase / glutarate-semialdehyde dehydrogenase [Arthrobacter sp. 31Cvi3.1E]
MDSLPTSTGAQLLQVAEQIKFGIVGFNAGAIFNAAAPSGGV